MERSSAVHYERIGTERELLEALSLPDSAILCGGTDLMVKMRSGLVQPETLLDISQLETLQGIRHQGSSLEIGAATTETDILRSPLVLEHAPLLATTLRQLGSIQIRNRGTLGGNIINASPAADSAVPLLLYDAQIQIVSLEGERWVPLDGFFKGPGRTALRPGEFVRMLRLEIPSVPFQAFYHKVGRRNALTISIASLGTLLFCEDDHILELRIAAGSVAPTPMRLRSVETALKGAPLTPQTIEHGRTLASSAIAPISDVRATSAYRTRVIGDLLARALQSPSA
jgi:CO/xanthine dehydrogenase FAD-binding subunit